MRRENGADKSIIKRILLLTLIQVTLSVLAFGIFVLLSYTDTRNEVRQSADNFLQVYGNEIRNRLERVDTVLEGLIYQNRYLIQLESTKELDRYYASLALSSQIKELTATDSSAEIIVVAEGTYDICLDAESTAVPYDRKMAVRQFVMESTQKEGITVRWAFARIDKKPYLYKMYKKDTRIEAAFISADRLLDFIQGSDYGKQTFCLLDSKQKLWAVMGEHAEEAEKMPELFDEFRYEQVQAAIVEDQVYLSCYVDTYNVLGSVKYSAYIIALFAVINSLYVILSVKYIRNQLLKPIQKITEIMDGIRDGDYQLRIKETFDNIEFKKLKETFNRLMDELIVLRIEKYEKQLELKDMEMKCVRLTLRPHFFLNAVTTIASLSMRKMNEQIIEYVNALSKTIRYMFRSGLHTVTIGEEIEHVNNYFEMQELKYPGAVFHFIEMEDGCADWKVPQLIIHTLIENEYKYAVTPEETLTILINIRKAVYDGMKMLVIEIEDDGQGYPEEMFRLMEKPAGSYPASGKRIGLWSIRKMLELMYARDDLFQIENVEPHGCMNRIRIPEKAIHEIQEETVQNQIQ